MNTQRRTSTTDTWHARGYMCVHPTHSFVAIGTRNNTDSNKLVIFSGIALYYGDTYIVMLGGSRKTIKIFMSVGLNSGQYSFMPYLNFEQRNEPHLNISR